mmetsp:Transcript_34626/g.86277  ORF Transcript_34626/g.86277 Transcript_34626/m.86277 type:complete len:231 (-) Transcript_34626:391-1083(-)
MIGTAHSGGAEMGSRPWRCLSGGQTGLCAGSRRAGAVPGRRGAGPRCDAGPGGGALVTRSRGTCQSRSHRARRARRARGAWPRPVRAVAAANAAATSRARPTIKRPMCARATREPAGGRQASHSLMMCSASARRISTSRGSSRSLATCCTSRFGSNACSIRVFSAGLRRGGRRVHRRPGAQHRRGLRPLLARALVAAPCLNRRDRRVCRESLRENLRRARHRHLEQPEVL